MKERKEGEQKDQKCQNYEKRAETLDKCPSRAAKNPKKPRETGLYGLR
jgi:hypothetical protein